MKFNLYMFIINWFYKICNYSIKPEFIIKNVLKYLNIILRVKMYFTYSKTFQIIWNRYNILNKVSLL